MECARRGDLGGLDHRLLRGRGFRRLTETTSRYADQHRAQAKPEENPRSVDHFPCLTGNIGKPIWSHELVSSQAPNSNSAARSTSSSEVYQPTLKRTVPLPFSGLIPIAASVFESDVAPVWQADPVEAHSSGDRFSNSAPENGTHVQGTLKSQNII